MQITVDMDSHSLTHTLKQESCYIVQHAVRGRVKNEELSGEKYGEAQPEKKKKKTKTNHSSTALINGCRHSTK